MIADGFSNGICLLAAMLEFAALDVNDEPIVEVAQPSLHFSTAAAFSFWWGMQYNLSYGVCLFVNIRLYQHLRFFPHWIKVERMLQECILGQLSSPLWQIVT